MGSRVALCTVASVLVVAIVIVAGIGTKKAAKELNRQSLINSRGTDEDVVELLRIRCRLELMRANEVVQDVNFHVPEEEMSSRNEITWNRRVLAELDTEKVMQALKLKVEHTLVDCLRNRNLLFPFPGEDKVTSSWTTWFLNYVYASPTRRSLSQSSAGAIVQSPATAPTPAPSSNGALRPRSTPSPPSGSFFPHDDTDPSTQTTASEQFLSGPNSSSDLSSHKQKSSGKTVLIAVVVTAAATFVISAMLFVCCRRVYGAGSGMRRNDERPLLSLSLSDYSVASSQKSFTLNSTTDIEKKTSNQTLDIYLNSHIDSEINMPIGKIAGTVITSTDDSASEKLAIHGMPPLKPPPGRSSSSISNVGPGRGAPLAPHTPAPPPPPPAAPSPPTPPPLPLRSSAGPRLPSSGPPPPPPPIPFSSKNSGGPRPPAPGPPPPPPPVPSGSKVAFQPPAPPSGSLPPARPLPMGLRPPRPSSVTEGDDADAPRAKLKPFFWDKVLANPDHSMVWHQIKSGSFQFNEEMIETLFGYAPAGKNKTQSKESSSQDPSNQYIQIIDPKKAQNLSILLKALNVTTEEVVDALQEGNELPSELIQTLLKMAPTSDEELKLRLYSGEVSRLGPAERFLKILVDIPFAFKRLEALNFMCILQEEETTLKESFSTLEAACNELRKSRLFLKLLEAVLKTGNRMNDGTFRGGAQAFKLDTLLKLSDVKGVDGKTTLLHFVVQEIIRSEGIRAARVARESASATSINSDDLLEDSSHDTEEHHRSIGLQVVSGLGNELENVKKAAILDAESLIGTVSKLGHALIKAQDLLKSEMGNVDKENGFHQTLRSFVQNADVDIRWLLEEEKRIMALVKSTGDYFHGNSAKDEGLRLFVIVRDFLIILEKVCKEVKIASRNPSQPQKKAQTTTGPSQPQQPPSPDPRGRLFPAIKDRRMEYSSSDDDNP